MRNRRNDPDADPAKRPGEPPQFGCRRVLRERRALPAEIRARASALVVTALLLAASAGAQRVLPGVRPGDEAPALPAFEAPVKPQRPILPPYPLAGADEGGEVPWEIRTLVEDIRITGNDSLPDSLLREIASPFEGRELSYSDLMALRDQLTLAYVDRGYVTSGATIPEQRIEDGVIEIRIIEGRLQDVDVEVHGRFRPNYFRDRIKAAQPGAVNVLRLQEQLELFQQDPRIQQLQARLEPTAVRGESRLRVIVQERPFYALEVDFDNYRSPSIGALGSGIRAALSNLVGVGDSLFASFAASEGLRAFQAQLEVPITLRDTSLRARYQYTRGDVVDSLFSDLGIESKSQTLGLELRQPLYRSLQTAVTASLQGDWRRSQNFLLGGKIGLPSDYSENGKARATVLRLGIEAAYRSYSQSLVFRSLLSWGIDALGATINGGGLPDGRFVSWLGQLQWASRLPWLDAEMVSRFDVQLASDPLLPMEQFAVGGRYSVRGYRENTLVRDNGWSGSVEVRVPVIERVQSSIRLEVVPFVDVGRAWNDERDSGSIDFSTRTLAGIGIGTRLYVGERSFSEFYWGHRLEKIRRLGEHDLQDDGIYFRIALLWN